MLSFKLFALVFSIGLYKNQFIVKMYKTENYVLNVVRPYWKVEFYKIIPQSASFTCYGSQLWFSEPFKLAKFYCYRIVWKKLNFI